MTKTPQWLPDGSGIDPESLKTATLWSKTTPPIASTAPRRDGRPHRARLRRRDPAQA